MIRTVIAVLLLLVPPPAYSADEKHYLSDQQIFLSAWEQLAGNIGSEAELFSVEVRPDRITVLVRAEPGRSWLDLWQVRPANLAGRLLGRNSAISGPTKAQPPGPGTIVEEGFFAMADLPADRFVSILERAAEKVVMLTPGRVVGVSIRRQISFGSSLGYGDVRWSVEIANDRETATATMAMDGRLIGIDISGTERGRTKDFLTQSDWPFAVAADGFGNLIGDGGKIYKIEVRARSITVVAELPDDPEKVMRYKWDGGSFIKDFIALPKMTVTNAVQQNLPFDLDEIGLDRLSEILAAARAEMANRNVRIYDVVALKQRPVTGVAQALWVVRFADAEAAGSVAAEDLAEMRIRADATLVSARAPASERPEISYTSALGVVAAIEEFKQTFGSAQRVHQVEFRPDRAEIILESDTPGMVTKINLRHSGLSRGSDSRPMEMIHNQAGLFSLDLLNGIDAVMMATVMGDAVGLMGHRDGEVGRVTIWSGAPFFRSPDGGPVIEVRVGLMPQDDEIGRAVFTLKGKAFDLVK